MTWIDKKDQMDTSGGWLRRKGAPPPARKPEKCYTVSQVAGLFQVDRRVVYKWLQMDEDDSSVIPPEGWFKLPGSGQIRIKQSAVFALQQQM
jgi:hypothetical protein